MAGQQRFKALCWIFFLSAASAAAQSGGDFPGFISRLNLEPHSQRTASVDSFVDAHARDGFPLTKDSTAYFVFRGKVSTSVAVTGDQTRWSSEGERLTRVPGTDVYYRADHFEPDARLDYKIIQDGRYLLDPMNPHTVPGGFGPNSELAMPAYHQPKYVTFDPTVAHGSLVSFQSRSTYIDDTLTVTVYLPPGYQKTAGKYPSLYVHDGQDYLSYASMANILDELIALKKIRPLICVFVPPGADRAEKYRMRERERFAGYIVKELVPHIDAMYRTDRSPSRRGTMGCSDGGHFAFYLGVNFPGTFGLAGGQSSSITDAITLPIRNGPKLPLRFSIDVGTYDIRDATFDLLKLNREFRDLLLSKGYAVTYAEYHEGHSWGNWRAHVANLLRAFFPAVASGKRR